jgi:hypothetical protein
MLYLLIYYFNLSMQINPTKEWNKQWTLIKKDGVHSSKQQTQPFPTLGISFICKRKTWVRNSLRPPVFLILGET